MGKVKEQATRKERVERVRRMVEAGINIIGAEPAANRVAKAALETCIAYIDDLERLAATRLRQAASHFAKSCELADLALSAVGEPVVADGVGWKWLPEVPTEEMMAAGLYQSSHDSEYADVCQTYMDMWKVSPERASPPAAVTVSED